MRISITRLCTTAGPSCKSLPGQIENQVSKIFRRNKSLVSANNAAKIDGEGPGGQVDPKEISELEVTVPWGAICGKIWGRHEENSGRLPILGIHGWQDNAGSYDRLIPLLNTNYFVAMELPGHGLSSHLSPGDAYTYADFVASVRRVIRHFKWPKFHIVGHSMGAGIGALYSCLYPSEVDSLVMLDLPKPISRDRGVLGAEMSKAIDAFQDLERKLHRASPVYSYDVALDRLLEGTKHGLSRESAKILMQRGATKVSQDGYKFNRDPRLQNLGIMRFTHEDIFELYNRLRCRILFAKAKDWPHYEPQEIVNKALEQFQKNCPEFEHLIVPGKHFFHLDNPEDIAGHINNFLRN